MAMSITKCIFHGLAVASLALTGGCIVGEPRRLRDCAYENTSSQYLTEHANKTLSIPGLFEMGDGDVHCVVTQKDLLGDSKSVAAFSASDVVARRFGKLFSSNFHVAKGTESPVVLCHVEIQKAFARKETYGDAVEAALVVHLKITNRDKSTVCYEKTLSASASAPWTDRSAVPIAFYDAVDEAVRAFVADWNKSSSWKNLMEWRNNGNPGRRPPSLKSIEWVKEENVWAGRCEVKCNEYEGFDAKIWANTQIAMACAVKLGDIEQERVRVVYDSERYDEQARKWIFEFRSFARTKIALSFNPVTRHGYVIGDVELMAVRSVEEASEILKKYVIKEMQSHGRLVKSIGNRHEAGVRFDTFDTDAAYNIITIKFRLIK